MPIYEYENPTTKEIFEILRPMSESDKDYILEDGTICKKILSISGRGVDSNAEVWKKCPDEVKKYRPKFVRHRSGYREPYNPHKHC